MGENDAAHDELLYQHHPCNIAMKFPLACWCFVALLIVDAKLGLVLHAEIESLSCQLEKPLRRRVYMDQKEYCDKRRPRGVNL